MKKRILAVVLSMTMAFSCLTACGEDNKQEKDKAETTTTTEATTTTKATTTTTSKTTTSEAATTSETTTASETTTTAKKQIRIIPATEIAKMTTAQLKAIIGKDYKAGRQGEYYGITSDYFPHVFLAYTDIDDVNEIKKAFDAGNNYVRILVAPGGLIGDNAYVGDTYESLFKKIECLCEIQVTGNCNKSLSIVDGSLVTLGFDNQSVLEKAQFSGFLDPNKIDCKCINASILAKSLFPQSRSNFIEGTEATVVTDNAPIYFSKDDTSPVMWTMKEDETVYVAGSAMEGAKGDKWYNAYCFTHPNGKLKKGYMKAKSLKV